MSKERLSRLQKCILEALYDQKLMLEPNGHVKSYSLLFLNIAESMDEPYVVDFMGGRSFLREGFKSIFSQSLRNLSEKGMIKLHFHKRYGRKRKVRSAKLTEKGENALNLTNKLRIREKFENLRAKVGKSLNI